MTELALRKRKGGEASVKKLFARSEQIEEAVRLRAFEVFQRRADPGWNEQADWMLAEREVLAQPAARLVEDENGFLLSLALPGTAAKDVAVTVLPEMVFVEAKTAKRVANKAEVVHFSEFAANGVFRRVDLPAPGDAAAAAAHVEDGILVVKIPKAKSGKPARTEMKVSKAARKAAKRKVKG